MLMYNLFVIFINLHTEYLLFLLKESYLSDVSLAIDIKSDTKVHDSK